MRILAIDPGPDRSGVVALRAEPGEWPPRVEAAHAEIETQTIVDWIKLEETRCVVCEWLTSYGAAVGASVLDTAKIVGHFERTAIDQMADFGLLTRPDVGLELCESRRAKKSQTAEAIRGLYPATGGGKRPVVGTKKAPGPLYGVKGHAWDALAVGLAWLRIERRGAQGVDNG